MARRNLPEPFRYRDQWRAQVTLASGLRPHADFKTKEEARTWIARTIAEDTTALQPQLGGPTQATLARALRHYAELYTIAKGGYASEINRINHYLEGGGLPLLRVEFEPAPQGSRNPPTRVLVEVEPKVLPSAFQAHVQARRDLRVQTYRLVHELARKSCSTISAADIRRLMTAMTREGYSESTIQKELALLKHVFNMAAAEWNWKGFENPVKGIKLGKSQSRFVVLSTEQKAAVLTAAARCDNPLVWPLIVVAMETTLRLGSLIALERDRIDLEGRVINVGSKTGVVNIPLSLQAVDALKRLPAHPSGRAFPMSANAVNMAWEGIRTKAGLPKLQFRDLRHVGATQYARMGLNAHQLQRILGHRTLNQAMVYINLVNTDVLEAMDKGAAGKPLLVPPPVGPNAEVELSERRTSRLLEAALRHRSGEAPESPLDGAKPDEAPVQATSVPTLIVEPERPAPSVPADEGPDDAGALGDNVVRFRPRKVMRAA